MIVNESGLKNSWGASHYLHEVFLAFIADILISTRRNVFLLK